MATTAPDNLFNPNPSDNYNLIADWATSMQSVQAALVKRGNMYVGTSAQRTAFSTAPEGVHWQDTNGSKLEYVRKSGTWELAVSRWSGPQSQRDTMSSVPEGFEWYDTTSKVTTIRRDNTWHGNWVTPAFQNGFVAGNNLAYRLNSDAIEFRGSITRPGGSIANTVAFTLPVNLRPTAIFRGYVPSVSNTTSALYYLEASTTGAVQFVVSSGGAAVGELNLGGVRIPV